MNPKSQNKAFRWLIKYLPWVFLAANWLCVILSAWVHPGFLFTLGGLQIGFVGAILLFQSDNKPPTRPAP